MNAGELVLIAAAALIALFVLVYLLARRLDNYGIVDIAWSYALGGAALFYALADAQLAAFKRDPAHRGRVCTAGLWGYSRHPNYFCEWLVWVAYFVFACGSPWGWTSVACPLCILGLLLGVTGIPMTEEQSLRSKGGAYRRYQRTTSAFVPWFPRKGRGASSRP